MSFVLKLVLGIFLFPGKIILWNRYISAPKRKSTNFSTTAC